MLLQGDQLSFLEEHSRFAIEHSEPANYCAEGYCLRVGRWVDPTGTTAIDLMKKPHRYSIPPGASPLLVNAYERVSLPIDVSAEIVTIDSLRACSVVAKPNPTRLEAGYDLGINVYLRNDSDKPFLLAYKEVFALIRFALEETMPSYEVEEAGFRRTPIPPSAACDFGADSLVACVTMLEDASLKEESIVEVAALERLRASPSRFDVFVDEPRQALHVRGKPALFRNLQGPVGLLLWLVLSRTDARITAGDYIRFRKAKVAENTVHKYRGRLGEALGCPELLDKMLESNRRRRHWHVQRKGWSFCWIRESPNPEKSELFYPRFE